MNDTHVKIYFRLERDSDDYPPEDVESMWGVPLGNGLYRLDNVPFFVRGVSAEDVVRAAPQDGSLFFQGLVEAGGHSTVRVLLQDRGETETVRDELRAMGCSSEGTHIPGLIAIDVPPSVRYEDLRKFLEAGERILGGSSKKVVSPTLTDDFESHDSARRNG